MRAAAVSALAKFGTKCDDLRPSIVILLSRCKYDVDDEVRDRATMFLDLLSEDVPLAKKMVIEGVCQTFSLVLSLLPLAPSVGGRVSQCLRC